MAESVSELDPGIRHRIELAIAEVRGLQPLDRAHLFGQAVQSALDALDAVEARLARVTDDSFRDRLARIIGSAAYGERDNLSRATEAADEVLAAIRAVAADERKHDPLPHRLCDQGCKDNQQGIEHCFNCREPWPCSAADEREGPEHTVACNAIWFDFGGCSCGATDEQEASDV